MYDKDYKGSEYMSIYPHVSYYDGTEGYTYDTSIPKEFYVCTLKENGSCSITPFSNWFKEI